jgi:riboflavin kinase/FMN adenylyltransferase
MRYVIDYRELDASNAKPRIVTIGNFDGVHIGHQAVLAEARKDADESGMELAVLTFEPHPAEFLKPDGLRLRLVEPERKADLLAEHGADLILAQHFDEQFASLSPKRFASDVLVRALGAKLVIIGENFRFGRRREGDLESLSFLGEDMGFEVRGRKLVHSADTLVSSSKIRELVQAGDMTGAGRLLGRCHELPGTVVSGRGQGSELGFPTINLSDIFVLSPASGIYAAYCASGGEMRPAAVYIGDRPTLGFGYSVEAHLLDHAEDLYGRRVVLHFVQRVRGDRKFGDKKSLVNQMTKDVERVRDILGIESD